MRRSVSVLSVEPWGLKPGSCRRPLASCSCFSALGRAVGFETYRAMRWDGFIPVVSVLSVEPWGLKLVVELSCLLAGVLGFSALGRAVGFETIPSNCINEDEEVSVLSVEPWGLKPFDDNHVYVIEIKFQCSRSSRGV